MTRTLWFVMPCHGRHDLTAICLRQLRHTCDQLGGHGLRAEAVIIADRDNQHELRRRLGRDLLGFATVQRDNMFLSRKFNDGFQLAFDSRYNPRPADYAVPIGSDDWVDWQILTEPPPPDTVLGFQRLSFVREDGLELTTATVAYAGGCGIRMYPRQLLARCGYRPADEDRVRACDTSILTNTTRLNRHMRVEHREIDPRQIVDWKTSGQQINSYGAMTRWRDRHSQTDPFEMLRGVYPDESLERMAALYGRVPVTA